MLLPVVLVAGVFTVQAEAAASRHGTLLLTGAEHLAPRDLMAIAAAQLDLATKGGGGGYTFTIVQRTSIDARPGGPLVDIPDPVDRHASLGKTDDYDLAAYVERGAAAPGGFWLEIRDGPAPGDTPDFEKAQYELGAIVRDGKTYRNDGDGWYPTDAPPGIGLDPRTASLLPTMLRDAADPKTSPPDVPLAPGAAVGLQADARIDDMPGVIAVDAETFTELTKPLDLGFDDQGRLVTIHAVARNTRLDDFDMVVDTTITFSYPLFAPDIPKPDPLIDPDATVKGEG